MPIASMISGANSSFSFIIFIRISKLFIFPSAFILFFLTSGEGSFKSKCLIGLIASLFCFIPKISTHSPLITSFSFSSDFISCAKALSWLEATKISILLLQVFESSRAYISSSKASNCAKTFNAPFFINLSSFLNNFFNALRGCSPLILPRAFIAASLILSLLSPRALCNGGKCLILERALIISFLKFSSAFLRLFSSGSTAL